jgi:hypothetical protein
MDRRELAYAKQTLLKVKDWDRFQDVIRYWATLQRVYSPEYYTRSKK